MNNKAELLIEAILSQQDDIFNSLFSLAAKCVADAYEGLDENLKDRMRTRLLNILQRSIFQLDYIDSSAIVEWERVENISSWLLVITEQLKTSNILSLTRVREPWIELLLRDWNLYAKEMAEEAFGAERLSNVSKDKDFWGKWAAEEALFEICALRDSEPLAISTREKSLSRLRMGKVTFLNLYGDPDSLKRETEPMLEALRDENFDVRYLGAFAIAEKASERAIDALYRLLKEGKFPRYHLFGALRIACRKANVWFYPDGKIEKLSY